MSLFPKEYDLLSLFECEPTQLDNPTKELPFYYNESTYQFSNGEENFSVTISPSYGEVKIQVTQTTSSILLSLLDLKRVMKFEITADKKDTASVLLTIVNEDSQQLIEIDFKPKYKLIFREHHTR